MLMVDVWGWSGRQRGGEQATDDWPGWAVQF